MGEDPQREMAGHRMPALEAGTLESVQRRADRRAPCTGNARCCAYIE